MSVTCVACGILASHGVVLHGDTALYSALWQVAPVLGSRRSWCEMPHQGRVVSNSLTVVLSATVAPRVLAMCAPGAVRVRPHDPTPFQPSADGAPWCCQAQNRSWITDHAHNCIARGIFRFAFREHTSTCSECAARVSNEEWLTHRYMHVYATVRAGKYTMSA